MDIRTFRQDDAAGVVDLWNTALDEDKASDPWYAEETRISSDTLERVATHPNHDPNGAFVACEGSAIVGYARGVVKRAKSFEEEDLAILPGYLEGLVVKPSCRGRGLGGQLLERVETFVKGFDKGALHIVRVRSPITGNSVVPDTPEFTFLLSRGFEAQSREMRLELNLETFELRDAIAGLREALAHNGIEIRFYEDCHFDSMEQLMERHFRNWWFASYRPNIEKETPSPVLVAVDREGDRVVGFAGFVTVGSNGRAGFSPGVDPDYRGKGIGKAMANLWADEVKKIGATSSRISTGFTNIPAKTIYFDMGYQMIGEFCSRLAKTFSD